MRADDAKAPAPWSTHARRVMLVVSSRAAGRENAPGHYLPFAQGGSGAIRHDS